MHSLQSFSILYSGGLPQLRLPLISGYLECFFYYPAEPNLNVTCGSGASISSIQRLGVCAERARSVRNRGQ